MEATPTSTRRPTGDDALDHSSVSAEFFRGDADSVPPLVDGVEEHHDEVAPVSVLHPAAIARRARLRRIVGAVVGIAGAVAIVAVGKSLASSKHAQAPQPVAQVAPTSTPKQDAPPEAKPAEAKPVAEAKPAPEAKPAEAPEPAKTAEPKAEEKPADAADAAKLKKEALNYLNRGRYKDAIEAARAAIAADPSDAMVYLYLGSALQDSGKWKEGIEAYSDCVRHAKTGPVHECAAMGGRK
ncbi:MAG: tetratricopeptide repeat protein [Polyangiaceae bacterium]|nr:tetratricopeptide repeat protein [Polyangiaceae bacterium]